MVLTQIILFCFSESQEMYVFKRLCHSVRQHYGWGWAYQGCLCSSDWFLHQSKFHHLKFYNHYLWPVPVNHLFQKAPPACCCLDPVPVYNDDKVSFASHECITINIYRTWLNFYCSLWHLNLKEIHNHHLTTKYMYRVIHVICNSTMHGGASYPDDRTSYL